MLALLCAILLTGSAACALMAMRIAASRGPLIRAALIGLRALGSLALCLLLWKVFRGEEEVRHEASPPAGASEVIVLQDRSASMDVLGGPGRTRGELAEEIWAEVEKRARGLAGPGKPSVKRYFFAENLVEEGGGEPLLRDGSRLSHAVTELLSRKDLRSLLIVSDGATTDGIAPPYFLDWARNRRIRINAIVSADPDLKVKDRAIQEVLGSPENPNSLTAKVRSTGKEEAPLTVRLSIDGSGVSEVERAPEEFQEVSLRLPPQKGGWHRYSVEIKPIEKEATELNNVFHGVFRTGLRGVLFIADRPRMENVHLARFLKKELGESFISLSPAALSGEAGDPRAAAAVILADVDPGKIPGAVRDRWLALGIPLVLLSGESLDGWVGLGLPGFPVIRAGAADVLGDGDRAGAVVTLSPLAEGDEFFKEGRIEPRLDLVREVQLREEAELVYVAKAARGAFPLLVSDSMKKPRFVVLLADTTWKWARHPDGRTRKAYETFWSTVLKWLGKEERRGAPLVLKLPPRGGSEEDLRGWVEAPGASKGDLGDCRIVADGNVSLARTEEEDEAGRRSFRIPRDEVKIQSGVLWIQAQGELSGRDVASERVPVAFNRNLKELRDIHADAGVLRRHATGEKDGFAWYPGRGAAIDSLFTEERVRSSDLKTKRRQLNWEILFAGVAILSMALEWWLERKLRAGNAT